MNFIFGILFLASCGLMVLIGYLTGASALIKALPTWAGIIFFGTQTAVGVSIYFLSKNKWGKWSTLVYFLAYALAAVVKHTVGVHEAMSLVPWWGGWSFIISIWVFGITITGWIANDK
ncbi:MAG: hypothetical protein MUC28_00885 [Planctomycetes bacterium]|jgi:hypothetical protein|nr:hypothetical protein [Planctomycetota bacterium]